MEYPKINSLFKRNPLDSTLIFNDYSCQEFSLIKSWRVEEKIDGTNIRIVYDPNAEVSTQVTILGRSKDSAMQQHLFEFLTHYFTVDKMAMVFSGATSKCTLYGEGYGNTIQAAGRLYQPTVGFMLFDVLVGPWWLTREAVKEKAEQLNIPIPQDLGIMTEEEIIKFVQCKPQSTCSLQPQFIEGIIARTEPLMLFRNGKPVMWKLKVKDLNL